MSGSLFSMVIMLSPLISRMFINIFLLLSIIIIFYDLLGKYAISVEGFIFWAGYSSFLTSRVALVETISSLPDFEGGVIPVSEVCELLIKAHDILDNAVSK